MADDVELAAWEATQCSAMHSSAAHCGVNGDESKHALQKHVRHAEGCGEIRSAVPIIQQPLIVHREANATCEPPDSVSRYICRNGRASGSANLSRTCHDKSTKRARFGSAVSG